MADGNADQIEYWNGPSSQKWVRNQQRMDRTLGAFSRHVIDVADVSPGESVLDIGCGCGSTSMELGARVGGSGRVVGVDVSRPMLEVAKSVATDLPVEFVEADASSHDLDRDAFDLLFSRFGVMFFADPDRAFAHIGGSVRSGGRVAFACWRPLSENPWMLVPVLVAKEFVELPARPGPEEPGPFSFANPERVSRILSSGGFTDIRIEPYDHAMVMGNTVEEAIQTAMEVGPVGSVASEADAQTQQALNQAMAEKLSTFATPEGVRLGAAIWCVTATKP
ncbi:MAG: methyltransferase [Minwuia thermotolerans]|nr:MAG: methyltransferase [Minwuia thermotolerans]